MTKKLLLLFTVLFITSCGDKRDKPFSPCSVEQDEGVTTITCVDGTEATVEDGKDGADGVDGENGTLIEVVRLCPEIPGTYPEILLRIENSLYAVLDGGPKLDRLVEVLPGTYMTTDGRDCTFTVTEDREVL